MMFRLIGLPMVLAACVVASAASCAGGNDEGQSLGAHEHGRGQLNVVVDGMRLEAELIVSAHDVLGFEHVAQSSEELTIKDRVAALLRDGLAILGPTAGASCDSVSSQIVFTVDRDRAAGEMHAGEDHSEHDHGNGHDDDGVAKNDKARGDLAKIGTHSEVHATYSLRCSNMAKLKGLALTYFEAFERSQSLSVNVVNDRSQFSAVVERARPTVALVE